MNGPRGLLARCGLFAGVVAIPHHEHRGAIFSPDGSEVFRTVHPMPWPAPTPGVVGGSRL